MPEKLAAPASSVNWKALYRTRHLVDRTTNKLLDSILATQTGRAQKFEEITSFGYDAKEIVLRNIAVDAGAEDVLARRFAILIPSSGPLRLAPGTDLEDTTLKQSWPVYTDASLSRNGLNFRAAVPCPWKGLSGPLIFLFQRADMAIRVK